jgi:hypothetical protein
MKDLDKKIRDKLTGKTSEPHTISKDVNGNEVKWYLCTIVNEHIVDSKLDDLVGWYVEGKDFHEYLLTRDQKIVKISGSIESILTVIDVLKRVEEKE